MKLVFRDEHAYTGDNRLFVAFRLSILLTLIRNLEHAINFKKPEQGPEELGNKLLGKVG